MELTMPPDPVTAALAELAAHDERLTGLDARENGHFTALSARIAELTDLITALGRTLHDDAAALARLEALDQHVAALAAQLASDGADPGRYRPDPATAWWKLTADGRQEPLARLRGWVEQVYRPGYGHLAALAPCWASHDLCLYGLDILSGLWSVLYLQPRRTPGILSAQAEYQARILPALAAQLATETTSCRHTRRRLPAPGPRSTP
jgi:hypothetical protein